MSEIPEGFGLALDPSVRRERGGRVLVGGSTGRIVTLRAAGQEALDALLARAPTASRAARALGSRLVAAGLAHPRPGGARLPGAATVVVPVRDRTAALDALLSALGHAHPVLVVDDGSTDAEAVAALCTRHGARLLALASSGGPAAARNAALEVVQTPFVAFVDSDCVPTPGWVDALLPHLADPTVGAVAPRIVPHAAGASVLARYAAARSPLDLGSAEGEVAPGRRVAYVPTAALLLRRSALPDSFDTALRFGEDVDAVWRLHDAGWRVRYVPSVHVAHDEPTTWRALLRRRLAYGTSAAPLALRHQGRLAPLVLRPWPTAALVATLAGRSRSAAAIVTASTSLLGLRLHGTGVPPAWAISSTARGMLHNATATGRTATMLAAPALLAALGWRRTRRPALALLLADPVTDWVTRRPPLDVARWTLAAVADDAAYGAGVWAGAIGHRTAAPLAPRLQRAARRKSRPGAGASPTAAGDALDVRRPPLPPCRWRLPRHSARAPGP